MNELRFPRFEIEQTTIFSVDSLTLTYTTYVLKSTCESVIIRVTQCQTFYINLDVIYLLSDEGQISKVRTLNMGLPKS